MKKLAVLAGATLALLVSNAQAAVFNVSLAQGAKSGGGTITIDDSLITPNGVLPTSQAVVSIEFDGFIFDTHYYHTEQFVFDSAGWEIASLNDTLGSFVEFSVGGIAPYLSFREGPSSGEFSYGGQLGQFSITRADNVVPLPAAFWLFGSVLGAGALTRRRRAA